MTVPELRFDWHMVIGPSSPNLVTFSLKEGAWGPGINETKVHQTLSSYMKGEVWGQD